MLVTIEKIYRNKRQTPRGEAISLNLQIKEMQDNISGWENAENKNWKIGDKVEVVISKNTKDDKTYYNFKMPNNKITEDRVREIIKEEMDLRFKKLMEYLKENFRHS